jgi:rod shape-determining protein MreC
VTLPRRKARASNSGWGDSGRLSRNPLPYLLLTVALGIGIGVLHNRLQEKGKSDPLLMGVRTLMHPFQKGTAHVQGSITIGWDWLFGGKRLAEENAALRADIAKLRLENEALRLKADEAARLRTALKFIGDRENPPFLAPVTGWLPSTQSDTITIGCGTRNGITARAIVRTPSGLVGQVIDTGLLSAQVLLLTDPESRVGGMVLRGGKPLGYIGIVRGGGRGKPLQMVYLKREDDIRPGDVVHSSGHGGVFPRDIPIGTVLSVKEDTARFTKSALLAPFSGSPVELREVLVLR